MVRNHQAKPRRAASALAVAVLAAFVVSGLAPLAAARPHDEARERHEGPDRSGDRPGTHFAIRLAGTATDRNNTTYQILITGEGRARGHDRDGDLAALRGVAKLNVTLLADDGSVVKQGELRARIRAHETPDGDWKWGLEAFGKKRPGLPRLVLHGNATAADDAGLVLEGKGHGVFKKDDGTRATPIQIAVTGALTRA